MKTYTKILVAANEFEEAEQKMNESEEIQND